MKALNALVATRYRLLLALLVLAIIGAPFLPKAVPVLTITVVLVVFMGALALRSRVWLGAGGLALAAVFVSIGYLSEGNGLGRLTYTVFTGLLTLWVAQDVFASNHPRGEAIAGGGAVYMLVGLFYAMVYQHLLTADPTCLHVSHAPIANGDLAVYFSFTTLTTLGFGDVVPTSPAARVIAISEAVLGTLCIAVVIARAVSTPPPDAGSPENR